LGGGVALRQLRRGIRSKSMWLISMSLTYGTELEYEDTRRDRVASIEIHPKHIFKPRLRLRGQSGHYASDRWAWMETNFALPPLRWPDDSFEIASIHAFRPSSPQALCASWSTRIGRTIRLPRRQP
jgi:hypothetical protein